MADYWKSQAKKYCEFCKCWIADNKPSIEFHEKGKRHKENVTLKLKAISKQSQKDHKAKKKIDDDMKKMEKAALEAYMKDVEAQADYTSKMLCEKLAQIDKDARNEAGEDDQDDEQMTKKVGTKPKKKRMEVKPWCEAVSDEGHTYYWNTESGESVWEPPEAGYMTLAEQKEWEEEEQKRQARKKAEEEKRKEEETQEKNEELRAFMAREKMKSRAAKPEIVETVKNVNSPVSSYGPPPKANPYGSWTTVKVVERKPVDLQLPEQKKIQIAVSLPSEPKIKFKEKTVTNLDSEDTSSVDCNFKKRKFNSNIKRNMRQKLGDD